MIRRQARVIGEYKTVPSFRVNYASRWREVLASQSGFTYRERTAVLRHRYSWGNKSGEFDDLTALSNSALEVGGDGIV